MHLKMSGQRLQRLVEFGRRALGVRRHGKAAGDQLGGAFLRHRVADQPDTLRPVLLQGDQAQRLGVALLLRIVVVAALLFGTDGRADAHGDLVAAADDLQLGLRFDELDQYVRHRFEGDSRVPDQRTHGSRQIEGVAFAVIAVGAQAAGELGVFWRQGLIGSHPGKRHRLRRAPAAATAFLLEGFDVEQLAELADRQRPQDARLFAVILALRLRGTAGQFPQRGQHIAPRIAVAVDEKALRRLSPGEDGLGAVEHGEQRVEPKVVQAFAQTAKHRPFADRFVHAQFLGAKPGGKQDFPEERKRVTLVARVLQRKRARHQRGIAQAHIDRMHPAAPVVMGTGASCSGFADAEFARQLEIFLTALRQQGKRIQPGDACREHPLADTQVTLAAFEGNLESLLSGKPLPVRDQRGRAQGVAAGAIKAIKRFLHQRPVIAL